MLNKFIVPEFFMNTGMGLVRIATGLIITTYGMEVFNEDQVSDYGLWLADVGFPWPVFMAYLGKTAELAGGIFLVLGLLTRLVTIPLIITMVVITFIMGEGNLRSDSFLLLLLFLAFFFIGSGKWSLDHWLLPKKKEALLK